MVFLKNNMKKIIGILPVLVIVMNLLCSCGNIGKSKVDEQAIRDSIAKAFNDSIAKIEAMKAKQDSIDTYNALHSRENIEKILKAFLSEYVNTMNDKIDPYLSADFKKIKDKAIKNGYEFNLFELPSAAIVEKYKIMSITDIKENHAKARVNLSVEIEGNYEEKVSTISLILEKRKWLVDEIHLI